MRFGYTHVPMVSNWHCKTMEKFFGQWSMNSQYVYIMIAFFWAFFFFFKLLLCFCQINAKNFTISSYQNEHRIKSNDFPLFLVSKSIMMNRYSSGCWCKYKSSVHIISQLSLWPSWLQKLLLLSVDLESNANKTTIICCT